MRLAASRELKAERFHPDSELWLEELGIGRSLPPSFLAARSGMPAVCAWPYQGAMNALNPVLRVIDQVAEAITLHQPVNGREARKRAVGLLGMVGIPKTGSGPIPMN